MSDQSDSEPREETREINPARVAPPVVRRGDVLLTLGHEIHLAATRLRALEAFEARVVAAAKSPAAWLALREELAQ